MIVLPPLMSCVLTTVFKLDEPRLENLQDPVGLAEGQLLPTWALNKVSSCGTFRILSRSNSGTKG